MKTALITGYDTNVIARVTAIKLLKKGYEIIAVCDSPHTILNGKITPLVVDYADEKSINDTLEKLKEHYFDAVINCHATLAFNEDLTLKHEFFDFDYTEFDRVMKSNVAFIAAVCIGLKDNINKGGCIVNVTSSASEEGGFVTIAYNASKAAIKNLSMSLANNFGTYSSVRVNCVAPGWIPQSKDVAAVGILNLSTQITPLEEFGQPDNVADAIISVIENPFINGVTIPVDGGIRSSQLMYMVESLEMLKENQYTGLEELISKINVVKKGLRK